MECTFNIKPQRTSLGEKNQHEFKKEAKLKKTYVSSLNSTRKQQLRFLSQTWCHINMQRKKRGCLILESITGSNLFNVAKSMPFLSKIEKIH